MSYYSIGEFDKKLNITTQTLRNWDKEGKLKPHHVSDGKQLQGKRSNKAKKMIKELIEDD